jgi:pyruvate/2-oxoglutarate/acetoin dehydrogenase E1 component
MNLAQTISELTRTHLEKNNGVAMGQCLTAVGFVAGTVPEMVGHPNMVELSMDDTCSSGIAAGYALAGRRPIFVCRYQGFMHFNQAFFTNFGAKANGIWGYKLPIFIRAVAMEGCIGPVAGSSHHGMITRMPGIKVCAPMTPGEYRAVWDLFMDFEIPFYVSEHRRSFTIDHEMPHVIHDRADITIYAISATRLNALEAVKTLEREGIVCNLVHLLWLKPLKMNANLIEPLATSLYGGLVLDTDFEDGYSKCVAYELMHATNKKVRIMGLEERTAGFAPDLDNLPPSTEKIVSKVKAIVNRR